MNIVKLITEAFKNSPKPSKKINNNDKNKIKDTESIRIESKLNYMDTGDFYIRKSSKLNKK